MANRTDRCGRWKIYEGWHRNLLRCHLSLFIEYEVNPIPSET